MKGSETLLCFHKEPTRSGFFTGWCFDSDLYCKATGVSLKPTPGCIQWSICEDLYCEGLYVTRRGTNFWIRRNTVLRVMLEQKLQQNLLPCVEIRGLKWCSKLGDDDILCYTVGKSTEQES